MRWLVSLLIVVLIGPAGASPPPLERETLETELLTAPAAMASRADMELIRQQRRRQETEGGWQLFGGADIASINEIIDRDQSRRFEQLRGQVGLRYPILGGRAPQRRALEQFDRAAIQQEGVLDEDLDALRAQFRAAYAEYWAHQRLERLATEWRAVLEEAAAPLEDRGAGAVRRSELAEVDLALREAEDDLHSARGDKRAALRELSSLLGRELPAFQPVWPGAVPVCTREESLLQAMERRDPAIQSTQEELSLLLERPQSPLLDEVNTNIVIAHGQNLDDWRDRGDETSVGITFDMPLSLTRARERRREVRNAEVNRLQHQLASARQAVIGDIGQDLARLEREGRQRATAGHRLRHTRATWRESVLRAQAEMDDGLLTTLRNGVTWYARARERIERERTWLRARIPIEPLSTADCPMTTATPPLQAALRPGTEPTMGFYIWQSGEFAERVDQDPDYLDELNELGVTRVLLSFSPEQVEALRQGRDGWLRELLHRLAAAGIDAELLLGDPHWILDEHRADLLELLPLFRDYPFTALHLDLEIDQLPDAEPRRGDLFDQWMATLAAVSEHTPRPLAVSLHPRYLEPGEWGDCPVCRLHDAGVDELVPMVYVTDAEQVAERLQPAVGEFDGMRFTVAQSVEQALPPANSYFTDGRGRALEAFDTISNRLGHPNMDGIMIQAWQDWEAMPE